MTSIRTLSMRAEQWRRWAFHDLLILLEDLREEIDDYSKLCFTSDSMQPDARLRLAKHIAELANYHQEIRNHVRSIRPDLHAFPLARSESSPADKREGRKEWKQLLESTQPPPDAEEWGGCIRGKMHGPESAG